MEFLLSSKIRPDADKKKKAKETLCEVTKAAVATEMLLM